MERFGIFDDIKMQLDSTSEPWLQGRKDLADLGIWVKEASRLQIRTGTEAGNAEASMVNAQTSHFGHWAEYKDQHG
jgi:outer membrane protein insertion porin family